MNYTYAHNSASDLYRFSHVHEIHMLKSGENTAQKNNKKKKTILAPQTNEVTTAQLTEAVKSIGLNQDKIAFYLVFKHFGSRLKFFIMKKGASEDVAEEVLQETMVNVWRKAQQFDPTKASVSTWVFSIARNVQIDLYRKAKRPELDINDPTLIVDNQVLAPEKIEDTQNSKRLKDLIDGLPEQQKEVLNLAFFNDLTHQEIAQTLEIPLGTVKSRIRLALKRIRAELGETK